MLKVATRLFHNTSIKHFNAHQVLGVQQNASQDEIKRAYRKLAKKFHPDISNSNKEKFQEIQKAYDILSGKEKPQQQAGGGPGQGFNPFGGAGGFNPFSGFGNMGGFGNGGNPFEDFMGQQQQQQQPTEMEMRMTIPFLDAVTGTTMQHNVRLPSNCKPCKGQGHTKTTTTCPTCKGMGAIERVLQGSRIRMSCPTCSGSGTTRVLCSSCNGAGYKNEMKNLRINIPPKTKSNDVIKIYHEDKTIYVVVRVSPHPTFRQTSSGAAECTLKIPILTAILGGKVAAPSLFGRTSINIKPGVNVNEKIVQNDVQYVLNIDLKMSEADRNKIKKAFGKTDNQTETDSSVNGTNDSEPKKCEDGKGIFGKVKDTLNKYIHPENDNK